MRNEITNKEFFIGTGDSTIQPFGSLSSRTNSIFERKFFIHDFCETFIG